MLLRLPSSVVLDSVMCFLDGRDFLRLESVARSVRACVVDERAWEGLCRASAIRQTGTRSRGRQPWRCVYAAAACLNCGRAPNYTMNSSCGGGGGRANATFALCEPCMAPGCALGGLRARLAGREHELTTIMFRVMATRRTIFEAEATRAKPRKKPKRRRNESAEEVL